MVDISQAPYFDDFDEDKGFHQILFVPARAVQVRELNQVQTMIQNQLQKFGDHVFENGSLVIPGELNYNLEYSYVKVTIADYDTVKGQLANQNVSVFGDTSGLEAQLIESIDAEDADPVTFYVKYLNGGTSGDELVFNDLEGLTIKNSTGDTISTATVIGTGLGSNLTINEGVFYVNGFFVKVDKQSIILDKYSTLPSYKIGFEVKEDEVNFNDDQTLLDNASGATNFSAPGANRRRIKLNLIKLAIGDEGSLGSNDFVETFRIRDGSVERKARGPEYNIFEDVLAQRTYDESGDYTVEPFTINILEHLDSGVNDGVYLSGDGGDESKFAVAVEQGRAYVRGYEVENESTLYLAVDKARDTDTNNNGVFTANLGYYIEIEGLNRLPTFNNLDEITFYDTAIVTDGAASGVAKGTANVRSISKEAGSTIYRLHIFNIKAINGDNSSIFLSSARSIYAAGSPAFTADIFESGLGDISIKSPTDRAGVFFLPNQNSKSLLDGGQSDTSFQVIRQVTGTTDGTAIFNLPTAGNNEVYSGQNDLYSYVSVPSTGEIFTISGNSTLSGSPTGKDLSINLGAGYENEPVIANVILTKQIGAHKTKTPTTATIDGLLSPDDTLSIQNADAFELVSVVDANNLSTDFTDRFELDPNNTQSYYGISFIKLSSGFSAPTETLRVTFKYFQHGSGDYFSVDSYSSIDYADIPSEEINGRFVSQSDVLDFRPTETTSGSFTNISEYPVPNSTIRADIEYYLPRVDKIFVDFEGNFGVKKGSSSLNPIEPNDPDNAMVLYILDVPAFTADATEINSRFVNNRRYTMRDIGKLEKRIENIEYYTVLNGLEKSTSDQQIIDSQTGLNRFKNGFVADPFIDHSVGEFTRSDYKCSVSNENQELRPEFSTDVIDMEFDTVSSSNIVEHENLITLPYTEQFYIEQLKASSMMNINPYAVFRWVGGLKLIPNSDVWVDTKYTRPSVTNKTVRNLGNLNQWWRSWVTRWAGSKTSGDTTQSRTNTTTSFSGTRTTTQSINASISTASRVVGDRVVETEVIPFMRSRLVRFEGKGLKPLGRVYCFFDDVDVTQECKSGAGGYGQAIYADADGGVSGIFKIPNNSSLRFRTGTKKFVVTDQPDNNRQLSQSFAESNYSAKGLLETRQRSILTTSTISASQENSSTFRRARRRDPLAQSFYVEREGGLFLTSVDIFFATKDANAPVTLQIREMVNGMPGTKIIPYSETVLNTSEVTISTNATVATTFTFSDPVYLKNETEYCIVLLANSIDYNVYVAGLGEQDITTQKYISKQPYSGVLFKSENNFTWTADQTKDLTFALRYAEFDTAIVGTPTFNNLSPEPLFLDANPIQTNISTSTVGITIPNHGLFVGSRFSVTGAVTGNGITGTDLNATHTVIGVLDNNNVEFTVPSTTATDTGLIGGGDVVADRNYLFNNITPMFEELNFNGTETSYLLTGTSGKSIDGTETPYQNTTYQEFLIPKDDHNLRNPWVIPNTIDNDTNNSGGFALTISGTMTTENEYLSPVIDKNRIGSIAVSNIINDPASLTETGADQDSGNAIARYVTKPVGLKDSAGSIKTFMDVNRPQTSNVRVYYRVGSTDEEVIASDWTEFDVIVAASPNDSEIFNEAQYEAESIGSFNVFQIKIVMLSASNSNIPRVKNFRTIALGT